MAAPIVRNYDKKTHKKCIKCRQWHLRDTHFGVHDTSSDGRQSICKSCKGEMNKVAQKVNTAARLRHHIASRCLSQLGDLAPSGFTENLEDHLGYRIRTLVKALRQDLQEREGKGRKLNDALNEGYHVDHIFPLSKFPVKVVDPAEGSIIGEMIDWEVFRKCWAIENLSAIPGEENLAKGAKLTEDQVLDMPDFLIRDNDTRTQELEDE